MLKINGNEFLCLDCQNGESRSGTGTELEVWCNSRDLGEYGYSNRVPFRVTKCSGCIRIDPACPPRAEYIAMQRQDYYIAVSADGKGTVLIPPDEAKRREMY